ncbi:MAG: hypothetical protein ABIQ93_05440, partial [Saprospiraceae bacterium]
MHYRPILFHKYLSFNYFRKLLAVTALLFLLGPGLLLAQKGKELPPAKTTAKPVATNPAILRDTAIAKLFEQPATIKWIRVFKGRIDDASAVDLTLGYDGRNCRGYLVYTKSKTRIRLDGTLLDSIALQLEERGPGNMVTGHWQGQIRNHQLEADWTNFDLTLGTHLSADEFLPGLTLNVACSENK